MVFIKKLFLTNFRCFKKYTIEFSSYINILVGKNAVGKTSIVEAVYCMGFAKSHRAYSDEEMIYKDETYAVIKSLIENKNKEEELIISLSEKGKKIKLNNKFFNRLSEYIGHLNVVMFSPEDLDIIKGSPLIRRKFIDINLSQIDNKYLDSLIKYRKLLKQRNEILKNITENKKYDNTLLKIVTEGLIKEAEFIIERRHNFITRIKPYFIEKIKLISENQEAGNIEYKPNTEIFDLRKSFEDKLKQDLFSKTTSIGPHRDDLLIKLNDKEVAYYGSQGQQRTLALAIKLALADLIKENNDNLIIILDDVFSELDINRQNQLLKLLDTKNQIFITTTTINSLSDEILSKSRVISIHKEEENE